MAHRSARRLAPALARGPARQTPGGAAAHAGPGALQPAPQRLDHRRQPVLLAQVDDGPLDEARKRGFDFDAAGPAPSRRRSSTA
jgi:hypothetical protein